MGRIHRLRGWGILPPAKPEPKKPEAVPNGDFPMHIVFGDPLMVIGPGKQVVEWTAAPDPLVFEPNVAADEPIHPFARNMRLLKTLWTEPKEESVTVGYDETRKRDVTARMLQSISVAKPYPVSTRERLLGSVPDPIMAAASTPFIAVDPSGWGVAVIRNRPHRSKRGHRR